MTSPKLQSICAVDPDPITVPLTKAITRKLSFPPRQ
ncbi:Uncharacterised protein [Mycobacterium tuberculosis]|uniref:Uncharacterized protein n=1 Tax=Mycobacterium tuberculosis TaxID=1773 RepID=A0A0U0SQE6_MYCTX|nr:hypothetical protein CAB90_01061 [Mycobacterium tuberculosis]CFS60719.1 Uncharacterised protein [Mycobacterium tuberculosis]CKQ88764.1 Uncharacterised protein [Mycobacterium tuberculosis]CKT03791.1 Uncharacterised protein [Mycobacterium tuberculosis]CKU17000.1 Uncharacterised protein [Mycobacterium tuberculosis]